jgi:hypothetical protein
MRVQYVTYFSSVLTGRTHNSKIYKKNIQYTFESFLFMFLLWKYLQVLKIHLKHTS